MRAVPSWDDFVDWVTLRRRPSETVTLAVLASLLFVAFLGWGFSSAVGSAPDDDMHLTSIWCTSPAAPETTSATGSECQQTTQAPSPVIIPNPVYVLAPQKVGRYACFQGPPQQSAACTKQESDQLVPSRINVGQYPSGFYRVLHVFSSSAVDRSVLLMRGFNALVAALLVTAAIWLTSGGLRKAVALSWLIGLMPLTAFLVPSTNPSSWGILGVGTFWAFLLRFLRKPDDWKGRTAGGLAVLTAVMATFARPEAPAFLGLAMVACAVFTVTSWRDLLRRRYWPLYAVAVLAVVVFFTRHEVTSILSNGMGTPGLGYYGTGMKLFDFNLTHMGDLLWSGNFGSGGDDFGLGWGEVHVAGIASIIALVVLIAIIVESHTSWSARKAIVVGGLVVVLFALPLYLLQSSASEIGRLVVPRYMLPVELVTFGFITLAADGRHRWHMSRTLAVGATLGVAIADAIALHTMINRYANGPDVSGFDLSHPSSWWWSGLGGPMLWWILGSVLTLLAAGALALTAFFAQPDWDA